MDTPALPSPRKLILEHILHSRAACTFFTWRSAWLPPSLQDFHSSFWNTTHAQPSLWSLLKPSYFLTMWLLLMLSEAVDLYSVYLCTSMSRTGIIIFPLPYCFCTPPLTIWKVCPSETYLSIHVLTHPTNTYRTPVACQHVLKLWNTNDIVWLNHPPSLLDAVITNC